MARDGMADLLTRLRRLVDDSGSAVWSDNELQDVLDEHKLRVWREPLDTNQTLTSGTTYIYVEYRSQYKNLEAGGTAYFKVEDASGQARGTANYTVDYINGVVTMADDQKGTALYLTGYSYDLMGAAAQAWRERATKVASYYDAMFDDQRLSRAQWFDHCLELAEHFSMQARPIRGRLWANGLFDE